MHQRRAIFWRLGKHVSSTIGAREPYLFLPGQQDAVVDGNLNLNGDLVEVRGGVPACRKLLRGWAVPSRTGQRMGASERAKLLIHVV